MWEWSVGCGDTVTMGWSGTAGICGLALGDDTMVAYASFAEMGAAPMKGSPHTASSQRARRRWAGMWR